MCIFSVWTRRRVSVELRANNTGLNELLVVYLLFLGKRFLRKRNYRFTTYPLFFREPLYGAYGKRTRPGSAYDSVRALHGTEPQGANGKKCHLCTLASAEIIPATVASRVRSPKDR